jgi:hypothetical protein
LLTGEARQRFLAHLADCDYCMARMGLLKRAREDAPEQAVSELTMARARRLARGRKQPVIRRVSRWAAAAVVVLGVLFVFKSYSPVPAGPGVGDLPSGEPVSEALAPRQIRNLNTDVVKLEVLKPENGAIMNTDDLGFSWTGVPGSLHYDVRLLTEDGDILWQDQVESTELELPGNLQLDSGTEYFFRVDAYLASAKHISSKHVAFSVEEHQ